MTRLTLTLSHPYKGMRERTTKQAEGKEPPSCNPGGPSPAAVGVGVGRKDKNDGRDKRKESVWR